MNKLYIYINDCIRWSGGLNILIQLISSIKDNKNIEFEIIYVKPSIFTKNLNYMRLLLRGGSYKVNKLIDNDLFLRFEDYLTQNNLKIIEYKYREFKRLKISDYIFPIMKINTSLKNKKLIGYIPDCQHLHLKELFLRRIIWYRNYQFKKVRKYCEKIISTSSSVKYDLINHYNFREEKIITLGFQPIRFEDLVEYSKPDHEDYFLIANQLWEHKNHIYAVESFYEFLLNNPDSKTKLLCTGYLQDHRNTSHGKKLFKMIGEKNLKDKILFLGYLDRNEFLNYVIHAKALIQPTLFEGTPGGLSTADAVSYGVDVYLSDINVNREVDKGEIEFFDISDTSTLAKLLERPVNVNASQRIENSKNIADKSKSGYSKLIEKNITGNDRSIVLDITSFIKWAGGTRLIEQFVELLNDDKDSSLYLIDRTKKNISYYLINLIKYRKSYKLQISQEERLKNDLVKKIKNKYPKVKIISKTSEIKQKFTIFPLLDFKLKYRNNSIYFIPDIGHKKLKENFNYLIRLRRYIQIRLILSLGKNVLVNSSYIEREIKSNYKSIKPKIFIAPYHGFIPEFEYKQIDANFKNKFTLDKYFIVCNQFWIHKNHITVMKALKKLNQELESKIKLICTGFKIDYRGNDHIDIINRYIQINNLEEDVIFTDFLDRGELLNLINNSIALVQPSLYEGGPGGFSSADAIALNKNVIISNIEINKEIKNDDRFIFFEPLDENDLSEKMKIVLGLDMKNNFTEKSYKDSYIKFLRDMISDVYFSVR